MPKNTDSNSTSTGKPVEPLKVFIKLEVLLNSVLEELENS